MSICQVGAKPEHFTLLIYTPNWQHHFVIPPFFCNLCVQASVDLQGDEIYDAMLNQTNVGQNNNKFYVIQALGQYIFLTFCSKIASLKFILYHKIVELFSSFYGVFFPLKTKIRKLVGLRLMKGVYDLVYSQMHHTTLVELLKRQEVIKVCNFAN